MGCNVVLLCHMYSKTRESFSRFHCCFGYKYRIEGKPKRREKKKIESSTTNHFQMPNGITNSSKIKQINARSKVHSNVIACICITFNSWQGYRFRFIFGTEIHIRFCDLLIFSDRTKICWQIEMRRVNLELICIDLSLILDSNLNYFNEVQMASVIWYIALKMWIHSIGIVSICWKNNMEQALVSVFL